MIFLQVANNGGSIPARFLKRFLCFACRNSIDFLFPDVGINILVWPISFVRDILGLRLLFWSITSCISTDAFNLVQTCLQCISIIRVAREAFHPDNNSTFAFLATETLHPNSYFLCGFLSLYTTQQVHAGCIFCFG